MGNSDGGVVVAVAVAVVVLPMWVSSKWVRWLSSIEEGNPRERLVLV